MRLYLCEDGSYAGTQADAKLRGKHYMQIDVPTDKDALLGYLNQLANAISDLRPAERIEEPEATPVPPEPQNAPQAPSGRLTAGQIEEFVLDQATVSEVERIFAVLGTRFAEGRR